MRQIVLMAKLEIAVFILAAGALTSFFRTGESAGSSLKILDGFWFVVVRSEAFIFSCSATWRSDARSPSRRLSSVSATHLLREIARPGPLGARSWMIQARRVPAAKTPTGRVMTCKAMD